MVCLLQGDMFVRSEEHTSELQSHLNLVCRLLLEENIETLFPLPLAPSLPRVLLSILVDERERCVLAYVTRSGCGGVPCHAHGYRFFFFLMIPPNGNFPFFPYHSPLIT